ncbi:MAG: arylamine N-acetyltransferase [Kiritimatiellae bacterium]|nr:arylamine N-acetyltransferase [Kiritimatiellia bacterium]
MNILYSKEHVNIKAGGTASASMPQSEVDLDAYFARIHYVGPREPTLAVLHAILGHHTAAIPFENLDVLLGRPIQLDAASLQQKLVCDHRGGYCFEQNGLLLLILAELGFQVTPLSARTRILRPRDFTPPRTHLFIRIEIAGEIWIADAGTGGLSLTAAIRLDATGEQLTSNEPRRIIREDGRYFHQVKLGDEWSDVCEFTGEEMPLIDRELANWWTSTNPSSTFHQNLMVARAGLDGTRRTILNREFTVRCGARIIERHELATPAELLEVLAQNFDLYFPAGTRFGDHGSPWPS